MNGIRSLVVALAALILAAPAQAQISFRAAAQSVGTAGGIAFRASAQAGAASGVLTLSINVPAGTVQNDVMVAAIGVRPNSVTVTAPAGWTLVRRINSTAGNSNSLLVYYRVAGAGEPANYAWGFSSSTGSTGGILSFSGVDTASPIDVENGQPTPNGLTHTAPSVNTTVANTMLVTAHTYSSAGTWTPPTGMTERVDVQGGGLQSTGINHVLQAATGATGTKAATASADADGGNAHILALRPAGPGVTINRPAGTILDDVMVASIAVRPSTATITAPAGWTLVRRTNNGAGVANSLATYWKVASASEPPSYTWNLSSNTGAVGGIQSFSGADIANAVDVESGQTTASSTAHATPSVTTTVADVMLVTSHAYASAGTWTPPAGMTEAVDVASLTPNNGAGISMSGNYVLQAAAGATGTKTATATAAADTGNAHIVALRPAITVVGLVSATIVCGTPNQVEVLFSVPVTAATAENVANYALDGGLAVSAAVLGADARIVTLTTTPNLQGQIYTLTVNNVAGAGGGTVAPNSQTTFFAEGGYLSGLLGDYYANMTLAGSPAGQRIDGPVDFNWGVGAPGVGGIGTDNFSVRWTGFVTPTVAGNYTLRTRSDDGVRLYLDGALIIDNWTDHGPTNNDSAPVALTAGQRYAVVMEYYENGGGAVAQLSWSGPATGGFQFIPQPNLSHFCGLPQPVVFLRLDESSWAAPGAAVDASGNGLNGTAFGGATPGPAQVCNGAVLDGNTRYVEVADDARLDFTGAFTVAAWINANVVAAALQTIVSKDENFEFHLTNAGEINWWWQNAGAVAQTFTTAGAGIAAGNWHHVAVVYAPGSQAIYVDGVLRGSGAFGGGLLNNADPMQIGSDQGLAGRFFNGRIDEVRVYGQALTLAQVVEAMNATRVCAVSLDHYNISHAGSGVACDTHQITITAHDASHTPVDAGARTLTLSTTNARGTWTGIAAGGGTLSDPTAGDGAASYTFAVGSNSVILNFRYANLAATSETFGFNANDGTYSENTGTAAGTEDPSFTLAQAGFRFNNVTDGNTTIPVQISGKPSNTGWNAKTLRIQAIQTDIATGSCSGLIASQTRSVDLGAECNVPAACAGQEVNINGGNIATSGDNAGAGAAAYSSVSLNFNASSEADTVIAYPDAGAISLHARFDLDPDVAGFEAVGASNPFVVRPFGLAFPGIAHSNTAAGTVLAAAGDNFALTVQGYQWAVGEDANDDGVPDAGSTITDNGSVPNFAANASVSPSVNLPGIGLGLMRRGVGCAGAASVALTGGAGAAADWCYSEAGNVLLSADVADYIVAGVNITGNSGLDGDANGGYVGRFKPKTFAVTGAPTLTNRWNPGCAPASSFTYLGEELTLGFTLEAQNAQNVLTQNYTGAYAKLNLGSAASLGLGARDGVTNLTARIDSALAPSGSFTNGVANLVVRTAVARATPDNPDGPFAAAQLGIAPNDADPDAAGGVQMGSFNLDVDGAGGNDHFAVGPTTALRFGRLRLQNAYGSATVALPMALEVQYWDGAQFQRNGDDSCTTLAAAGIGLSGYKLNLGPGETAIVEATIAFASGSGGLTMSPPGAANNGSVLLTPDLAAAGRSYLRGRWGGATWDQDPSATAAFGLYGSQPKNFIFFRENY